MAGMTRIIRDLIINGLKFEPEPGSLHGWLAAFRESLIPDLDEHTFADRRSTGQGIPKRQSPCDAFHSPMRDVPEPPPSVGICRNVRSSVYERRELRFLHGI